MTTAETAELIGVHPVTLKVWRAQGRGPAFVSFGRTIRYAPGPVITYIKKHQRTPGGGESA